MEERLKHRLVGAIVLVSLAVVIVPMVLDAPPEFHEEPNTAPLPERPQGDFEPSPDAVRGAPETPRLDAEIERELGQSVPDDSVTGMASVSDAPPPGSDDPFPSPRTPGGSAAEGTAAGAEPEPGAGSNGWTVQLGSFQKPDNAHALRDRLRSKGYDAYVEAGDSAAGSVSRVFVGRTLDREQARRSAAKLQRDMQLEGFVVRYAGS